MRGFGSIVVVVLTILAAPAWGADPATIRAAEAGVSPDFCPTLKGIVAAAASGFASLRGPARTGGGTWQGTQRFSGSDCTVFGGTPAAYACTLYAGDVEETADGAYARAASGVRDCLAAGDKVTTKADGVHARATTVPAGNGPVVRVVERDVSADAYLVELWVDAAGR